MNQRGRQNGVHQIADGPALTIVSRLSGAQLLGLALLPVGLWVLWQLWAVAGLLLLALIVAAGLEPAVSRLQARGVSRLPAVLGLYAAILGGLGSLGYVIGRVVVIQAHSLGAALPGLIARWQTVLGGRVSLTGLELTPDWFARLSLQAAGYATLAVQGILAGLLVLLIAFYLLLDGQRLWQITLRLVPDERRLMVDALGREMARKLRGYLRGVALSGLAVGILTGAGLWLLNVPYALLFGLLAGLLEAIPHLGPLLAAIGPVTFALAQSPTRALMVVIFFVAVQQIEDKTLVPRLQAHTTGLHPLTVILAILVLGSLFGMLGVLLAVPIAAAGQALVVCVISCFYHPEGTATWLAGHRPDFSLPVAEPEKIVAASPVNQDKEDNDLQAQILKEGGNST